MTLPEQEKRAVIQTEEFLLKLIREFKGIPQAVREHARACLHHYPTRTQVDYLYELYDRDRKEEEKKWLERNANENALRPHTRGSRVKRKKRPRSPHHRNRRRKT